MHFTFCEGGEEKTRLVEPGEDSDFIERSLNRIFEKEGWDRFAILEDKEQFYVQVAFLAKEGGKENEGFILEYRDGSKDEHYRCLRVSSGSAGLMEVTRVFNEYLHHKDEWRTSFEWERDTFPEDEFYNSPDDWDKYKWLVPWAGSALLVLALWYFGALDRFLDSLYETIGSLVILSYIGFPLIVIALLIYIAGKISDRSDRP